MGEYRVKLIEDRPLSGMWHCGPNAAWVEVTHIPTMISARAFDTHHYEAKKMAQACCEMLVEQSRLTECRFPERIAVQQGEYICKCGLRVEPHRCRDIKGDF